MRITIEPTGDVAQLANASQGSVWRGVTETGTPIVAIVVTLGCQPEDQAAFDRDFAPPSASPQEETPTEPEETPAADPLPVPRPA